MLWWERTTPFGKSCRPAGIHDVDGIVKIKGLLPCDELVHAHFASPFYNLGPPEHSGVAFLPHEDGILEEWKFITLVVPGARGADFRTCFAEHADVIRGLERSLDDDGLDLCLL